MTNLPTWLTKILPPLHLLAYSSLLGMQLYQTFTITTLTFRSLPRPSFITLQKRLFPTYFLHQLSWTMTLLVTYPIWDLWQDRKEVGVWALGVLSVMGGLNWGVWGPRVKGLMSESGRGGGGGEREREEGRVLERRFKREHALCIHLNLVGIGAALCYGVLLGFRLENRVGG